MLAGAARRCHVKLNNASHVSRARPCPWPPSPSPLPPSLPVALWSVRLSTADLIWCLGFGSCLNPRPPSLPFPPFLPPLPSFPSFPFLVLTVVLSASAASSFGPFYQKIDHICLCRDKRHSLLSPDERHAREWRHITGLPYMTSAQKGKGGGGQEIPHICEQTQPVYRDRLIGGP